MQEARNNPGSEQTVADKPLKYTVVSMNPGPSYAAHLTAGADPGFAADALLQHTFCTCTYLEV